MTVNLVNGEGIKQNPLFCQKLFSCGPPCKQRIWLQLERSMLKNSKKREGLLVGETRILDTFIVESDQGLRSFKIYEGDIFQQQGDLLVLSTHSSRRNAPTGWILSGLQERLGRELNLSNTQILSWKGISVHFEELIDFQFKGVLTLRIPLSNIESLQSENPSYEEVINVLTAALTILENLGISFGDVSFPVIAGQRISDILSGNDASYKKALEILIEKSTKWLSTSRECSSLNLFVFEPEKLELVSNALNSIHERHKLRGDFTGEIIASLISQVNNQITVLESSFSNSLLRKELKEFKQSLSDDPIRVQLVNVGSRALVENMARDLCEVFGIRTEDKRLVSLIEKLKNKLSPWIISYMDSIRLIGNSSAHSAELHKNRVPQNIEKGDLLAALGALTNLLSLWINIRNEDR